MEYVTTVEIGSCVVLAEDAVRVGSRYSVYRINDRERGVVWGNGHALKNSCGNYCTFAVRVLGMSEYYAVGITAWGEYLEIPYRAFGNRIPDVTYLPGRCIVIGARSYSVESADDSAGVETYGIRVLGRQRGALTPLVLANGGWFFGKNARRVAVKARW